MPLNSTGSEGNVSAHAHTEPTESPATTTQPSLRPSPAATARTSPMHPTSSRHSPVARSHTLVVLAQAPLTILVPSGVTATEVTEAVWPVRGSPTGVPVARSHTR